MDWRSCSRIIAIGGICVAAILATGTRAHSQAMQVVGGSSAGSSASGSNAVGFNPYDPQWALSTPFGIQHCLQHDHRNRPAGLHDEVWVRDIRIVRRVQHPGLRRESDGKHRQFF